MVTFTESVINYNRSFGIFSRGHMNYYNARLGPAAVDPHHDID